MIRPSSRNTILEEVASSNTHSTDTQTPLGWGARWSFMLAAAGSSIGLGNVWKFPYEVGAHGGGTFLLVYLPCIFLVAYPLMKAEVLLGRYGRKNPVQSILAVAEQERLSSLWQVIGWLGMLTSFLIFTFYSVVGSWILFYIMRSVTGAFVGMPAEIVQHSYTALLRNTDQMLIWQAVFVLLVVVVLTQGLQQGLVRALRVLMPLFVGLLVWLCVYASQVGDLQAASQFLMHVDLNELSLELFVSALGQALFSMSIGLGALIMFGAYFREERSIASAAMSVMLFDTAVAILMAVLIFSIVFAFGMRPDSGPGLIFETLPVAFSQMTDNSIIWSSLFFLLILVASLTSALALLEPPVAMIAENFGVSRRSAAWLVGILAWIGGLLSVYSFSDLKFSFYYFDAEYPRGFFDLLNILTTHVLMPLTALLVAILAAWRVHPEKAAELLAMRFNFTFRWWLLCARWLAPFIICAVLAIVLFLPA